MGDYVSPKQRYAAARGHLGISNGACFAIIFLSHSTEKTLTLSIFASILREYPQDVLVFPYFKLEIIN